MSEPTPVYQTETTESYWDCECELNYIHPKTQTFCAERGSTSAEQPDSRPNEVAQVIADEQKRLQMENTNLRFILDQLASQVRYMINLKISDIELRDMDWHALAELTGTAGEAITKYGSTP